MGAIEITSINRTGSVSQQYRIEYRLQGASSYISGPTLTHAQAAATVAGGVLPIRIMIPTTWENLNAQVRIVTICTSSSDNVETEVNGLAQLIPIMPTSCGPR